MASPILEHELGQTLGNNEGQRSLACSSPWGHEESGMTWQLNSNNSKKFFKILQDFNYSFNFHKSYISKNKLSCNFKNITPLSSWTQCADEKLGPSMVFIPFSQTSSLWPSFLGTFKNFSLYLFIFKHLYFLFCFVSLQLVGIYIWSLDSLAQRKLSLGSFLLFSCAHSSTAFFWD